VLVEYENGALKRRYVHGPGIDEALSVVDASGSYYLHADRLGTVEAVSNSSGQVVSTIGFDSFGEATGALASAFGFTGREFDSETGLYFYRARYYSPSLGRFTSKDPIGLDGGDVNFYGYVGNNPVNYTDPWGLKWYDFMFQIGVKQALKSTIEIYVPDPAAQRIVLSGIGGAARGALAGAVGGSSALGVGALPGAAVGASVGLAGGLLWQVMLESTGTQQTIDDLVDKIREYPVNEKTPLPDDNAAGCR
jgi:RHS repeat-associated protein